MPRAHRYDPAHRYPYRGRVEKGVRVGLFHNGISGSVGPWFVATQRPDLNWDYRDPTAEEMERIVVVGWDVADLPVYRLRLPERELAAC